MKENVNELLLSALIGSRIIEAIRLIESGADVDYEGFNGNTPLILAAEKGYVSIVNKLLEKGANVNKLNTHGKSPLMSAVIDGNYKIAHNLIKHGAYVDIKLLTSGKTLLMYAAENNKYEILKLLLDNKADPNIQSNNGMTALLYAIVNKDISIVEELLKRGANVFITDKTKKNALMYAAESGSEWIIQKLLAKGMDINAEDENGCTAFLLAAKYGNESIIKKLLRNGANISKVDKNGDGALIYAALKGNADVIKTLLEIRHDMVDIPNKNGETALIHAFDFPQVMRILISYKADVNRKDAYGDTVLISAVERGLAETVRLLCINGAKVNEVNNLGQSALWQAAYYRDDEIIKLLVEEYGANVNVKDNMFGTTVLIQAIASGCNEDTIYTLLENGANIEDTDDDLERTALMYAIANNNYSVVELLLSKGADVTKKDVNSETALMRAHYSSESRKIKRLIKTYEKKAKKR